MEMLTGFGRKISLRCIKFRKLNLASSSSSSPLHIQPARDAKRLQSVSIDVV